MTTTYVRRFACVAAASLSLVFVLATEARGADATIAFPFPSTDQSGVAAATAPGFVGCGGGVAGGCMTPGAAALRISTGVAVPARRRASVQFAAPAGTIIVGGSIRLRYRTKQAGVNARVQQRFGSSWVDRARLHSSAAKGATVALGQGATAVSVVLTADRPVTARVVRSDSENMVAIDGVSLVVRDLQAPTVAWADQDSGATWLRGMVCRTATATDTGLGVDHIELSVGSVSAMVISPPGPRLQPRPLAMVAPLCVDTAQLADGTYGSSLVAVDTAADGNRSAVVAGVTQVDNAAPTVTFTAPNDPEARQPELRLAIDERTSGIDGLKILLDGEPLIARLSGSLATATAPRILADGAHRVSWEVTDVAGNLASGAETFAIADTTVPVIDEVMPIGLPIPSASISARVTDSGAGVAADAIRVAVDGSEVTALVDLDGSSLRYQASRPWEAGEHTVRITATDRSGNRTVRTWTFSIPVPPRVEPTPSASTPPEPTSPAPLEHGPLLAPAADSTDGVGPGLIETTVVSAPAVLTVRGRLATLRLMVTRGGVPAVGLRLRVAWRGGALLGRPVVDDSGLAILQVPASKPGVLEIDAGDAGIDVRVEIGPQISMQSPSAHPQAGRALTLRGAVHNAGDRAITIEARVGIRWQLVTTVQMAVSGRFSSVVLLPNPGRYIVRARAGLVVSRPVILIAR